MCNIDKDGKSTRFYYLSKQTDRLEIRPQRVKRKVVYLQCREQFKYFMHT